MKDLCYTYRNPKRGIPIMLENSPVEVEKEEIWIPPKKGGILYGKQEEDLIWMDYEKYVLKVAKFILSDVEYRVLYLVYHEPNFHLGNKYRTVVSSLRIKMLRARAYHYFE